MSDIIERLLKILTIIVIAVWSLFPIAFVVVSSIKPPGDIFAYPPKWLFTPTLQNYVDLWLEFGEFFHTLGNSIIVSIGATVFTTAVGFMAGYVYSRYSGRLIAASALYMIAIRLLPPIVVTLPLFPIVSWLRLSDTHIVLILLYSAFWVSLVTVILKTFIDEIPRELDEAAEIDGASQWQILMRVILPLTAQGLAAGAIFVFIFAWNEFLFALIFTTSQAKTAPLVLSEVMDAIYGTSWGVLFAGVTIQLLPVLLLVVLANRLIVAGLTAGSVKG
ncbi:carbohydrate ABC transporter permease [Devosia ginsengisoli]|uniref:Carbohydrate ABC transporter permease n=1 Tax=Devosia ginsengisoli TaxID=400770 RepID=A0A5B8LXN2_9HYPH|nr:carbohydrate ABC transporter permease [Devosia ginsengisoli]QDZ12883.1 carbohydrate ABC transporter permease [Devosia ginsengisoli]